MITAMYPRQSWTGEAACFFPAPAPRPTLACAVYKAIGRGLWLKADGPARLKLDAQAGSLSLCLKDTLLAHADAGRSPTCRVVLLPADSTGEAWLLLFTPMHTVGTAAR